MFAYILFVIMLAMILNITLTQHATPVQRSRRHGMSEAVAATGARTAAKPAKRAFVRRNPAAARLGIVVLAFVLWELAGHTVLDPQFPQPAVGHHRRRCRASSAILACSERLRHRSYELVVAFVLAVVAGVAIGLPIGLSGFARRTRCRSSC